jgi:hypothetical protein
MLRWVLRLTLSVAMVTACASAVVAECAAPAQSGLAMCFPSVGSTVLYPATIELAANSGGVAITHVSVYDGTVKIDDLGFVPGKLIDGSLKNGFHRVTVNAWDADGKLYQAKSSFTVIGFGTGSCAAGSGAVTLCSPAQGSYQPESSVSLAAAFAAGVKSWSIVLDGKALMNSAEFGQPAPNPLYTEAPAAAGNHTMVVSTVDGRGVTSTVARKFSTFYDGNCNPKSGACNPGIMITQPNDIGMDSAGDEATKFRLQAEVQYNPKPTTKMIVYLDGTKVQQSAGPGITANVNAAKGSHYLVILAWDTSGNLYETYGNVDVQ